MFIKYFGEAEDRIGTRKKNQWEIVCKKGEKCKTKENGTKITEREVKWL